MYSEAFRPGVNIIHGDNGSGKSTIADFIFFAMGGDLREWKPDAAKAEYTLAELTAGETTVTVRRDVSPHTARPMQIHFGNYASALKAGPTEWRQFPYKRQDDQYSFSQVLFKAIGIPEAISDGSSNITMHQLLRILYGDQMTPIQRIFRTEAFDTWQIRQAVGELMCGIGGYDLYERQIQLRLIEDEFDGLNTQLKNLFKVASSYDDKILAEHIQPLMVKMTTDRKALFNQLDAMMSPNQQVSETDNEAERLRKELTRDLGKARRAVAELEDRVAVLEYEIEDSNNFISHLEATLSEFNDATTTFFALGQIRFEFCPACFTPTKVSQKQHECHLCGSEVTEREPESAAIAVRLDIEMQLKESNSLQAERAANLTRLKSRLRGAKLTLSRLSDASEIARRGYGSERENMAAELGRKIGYLDSEIQVLQKRLDLAAEIGRLSKEKEELSGRITKLKNDIAAIIAGQEKRKTFAYTAVSEKVKSVLTQDLTEHNDFGIVDHISFSFAEDWMAINDDKNKSRSASGMVILKNGFLFGMYLASLADPQFALPRFLLLDNIEDKGMVPQRSWNFQKIIVNECSKKEQPQQIIFTTSILAPELAGSEYIVGRKYTRERKSLDLSI